MQLKELKKKKILCIVNKLLIADIYHKKIYNLLEKMQRIRGYIYNKENVFCYDIFDKNVIF